PAPGRSESAVQKWNLDVPREKLGELTQPSTPLPVPKFSYLHHGLLGTPLSAATSICRPPCPLWLT
ncbi:MAG: hypothetical protein LAN64_20190, partial [Acidobacteriia bacterium]|nr:hypothetical protein [Terriglobia bacterium]